MIYYISDLHFNHEGIIRLCHRPYSSIKEMNEDLINKWNNKVKAEDTVYFLGDFSFKCPSQDSISFLARLNGKKYFIKGNHDKKSLLDTFKHMGLIEDYYIYTEIVDNNRRVVLFHYPIEDWNGQYRGSYHLYGHVHNCVNGYRNITNRFNVSAEVIGYEPVTLDELIQNQEIRRAN